MEEPSEIGQWRRILVLGSGAFGVVSLWQHTQSKESIAVKKCKFLTSTHITERHRKRWENEVHIMKSLNCPNIVSFKPLPQSLEAVMLRYNPTRLPLLSMEYCSKGNLRHVLSQVKNYSGLQENEVRAVLKDITQGVAYLHKLKITHRDIKPENIVLQQCPFRSEGITYKLIDLGYAKELCDTTVSFVGTLHYLAPEIMKTENYNHCVDYWSLGIVVFEVVCGVLPFLPQFTPMERFPYIERKKPEHICIYQLQSGSVIHSPELLKENYISTSLKQHLEVWLRHVLQFNPAMRECTFQDNKNVFDYLLNILEKKFVSIFSIYTLEFYSYEINDSTLIGTLKDWIARDTKVKRGDQVLLAKLGLTDITDDKCVIDVATTTFDFYVFKKGAFISRDSFCLPKYVKVLFENIMTQYSWRELRPIYSKCIFYLTQEEKMISSLMAAFKLYSQYVCDLNKKLKLEMKEIHKTLSNLLSRIDCYYNVHSSSVNKLELELGEEYKKCLEQFQQMMINLEKCIFTTNELLKNVNVLAQRQVLLEQTLPNVTPVIDRCDIGSSVANAIELVTKSGSSHGQHLSCKDMVKIVSKAIKDKDKLLNNNNFRSYSKATSVAIKDAEMLLESMSNFLKFVKDLSTSIDGNQREQYLILLSAAKSKRKVSLNGTYSNIFVYLDTDSLIHENQELRCQFQEALGQMFTDHKKFCDEIQRDLNHRN